MEVKPVISFEELLKDLGQIYAIYESSRSNPRSEFFGASYQESQKFIQGLVKEMTTEDLLRNSWEQIDCYAHAINYLKKMAETLRG